MHVGVWLFDGFPTLMIAVGIATQLSYSILLRTFPFISIASPAFLLGCGEPSNSYNNCCNAIFSALLILHHYLTFNYFTENLFTFQEVFYWYIVWLGCIVWGLHRCLHFLYSVCGWYLLPSLCRYRLVTMSYPHTVLDQ